MGIFDKLSSIFHIDLSKLKNLNIHIFSDNESKKVVYHDNRTININIGKLSEDILPKLQEVVKESYKKEGIILEDEAKSLLTEFGDVDAKKENREFLEYFKGKISTSDLEILRAAQYIKTVYDSGVHTGKSVWKLKLDVIKKYGERGKNICNLYSAGYFTSLIKPLYEELSKQSNFTPSKFMDQFDSIVMKYPFAVFVHVYSKKQEIKEEIQKKMKMNKQYGIDHLTIHGIGSDNVMRIHEIIDELKSSFSSIPEIDSGRDYINAEIFF